MSPLGYFLQRCSALIMIPLVAVHLGLIIYAMRGGLSAAEILDRTQGSFGWALFYGAFVLAVALHAGLGLRNILDEATSLRRGATAAMAHGLALALLILGLRAVYAVVGG